jgi:hypothetical protein
MNRPYGASALGPFIPWIADIALLHRHVSFVPDGDICSAILSPPTRVDGGVTRASTWRFDSMAIQELECGLAKGPRRLQTKGMRGVGKDDLLRVREIAR